MKNMQTLGHFFEPLYMHSRNVYKKCSIREVSARNTKTGKRLCSLTEKARHSSGCAAAAGFKQKSPSSVSEMPHGFLELPTTNDVADAGEISAT